MQSYMRIYFYTIVKPLDYIDLKNENKKIDFNIVTKQKMTKLMLKTNINLQIMKINNVL